MVRNIRGSKTLVVWPGRRDAKKRMVFEIRAEPYSDTRNFWFIWGLGMLYALMLVPLVLCYYCKWRMERDKEMKLSISNNSTSSRSLSMVTPSGALYIDTHKGNFHEMTSSDNCCNCVWYTMTNWRYHFTRR